MYWRARYLWVTLWSKKQFCTSHHAQRHMLVETGGESWDSQGNGICLPFLAQRNRRLKEYSYKAEKIAFFNSAEYCCRKSGGLSVFGIFYSILVVINFTASYMSDRSIYARFEERVLDFKKLKLHAWLFVKFFLFGILFFPHRTLSLKTVCHSGVHNLVHWLEL